jgi:hypothetical protein
MRLIDRKKPINQSDEFYSLDYRWIVRCSLAAGALAQIVKDERRHEYFYTSPVTVCDSRNRLGDIYVTEALTYSLKKDYGLDLPDELVTLVAKKKWLGQANEKLDFIPPPELRGRGIGTRSPKVKQPGRGGQIGIEEHHLLPQNKVMKAKFKAAGIDVDDFTIALDFDLHRQIHNKTGLANDRGFYKRLECSLGEVFR